jgi:hypothetical protein
LDLLLQNGDGMLVLISRYCNAYGSDSILWGQKYLTHVGNFEIQDVADKEQSSYGQLFAIY